MGKKESDPIHLFVFFLLRQVIWRGARDLLGLSLMMLINCFLLNVIGRLGRLGPKSNFRGNSVIFGKNQGILARA